MTTSWLRASRQEKGWTQQETAQKLSLSQPYLSLLEQGRRPMTKRLLAKLQRHFEVPATALPAEVPKPDVDPQHLAEALGGLGYPGFAYLKRGTRWHPAQVLLSGLRQSNLEARLAEALPWVILHYPTLNWNWLVARAKLYDVQNRLGFILTLARELAERANDAATANRLHAVEQQLERARLAREDTLGREAMTTAERRWLHDQRSPAAEHWNLLTDLAAERLPYAV
jgi:transcriptional regulator with XRE-family HTH domain